MMSSIKFFVLILVLILFSTPKLASARVPRPIMHLGCDLQSNVNGWPLAVIIGGGSLAGELSYLDSRVDDHFTGGRKFKSFDRAADIAGGPYVIDGGAVLIYGITKLAHFKRASMTAEAICEALALTEGSVLAIKGAVRRRRPDGGNYSFPSGHAARTFAVASVLETMHGPAVGIPAFLAAGAISFSRIDQRSHYLSDVIFGAAWGAAIGWGTATFHKKLEEKHLTIVPSPGPGLSIAYSF